MRTSEQALSAVRASKQPLIIAGGGVLFSQASQALAQLVEQTGIPMGETQAGKGSLPYDHPQNVGAVGATGTLAANRLAQAADLIIGIGTRYSDFTTASKTAFQNPDVRFININIAGFDAIKHSAIPLAADARVTIEALTSALRGYRVAEDYSLRIATLKAEWEAEVDRLFHLDNHPLPAQSEVIGAIWEFAGPKDVLVSAAGSHPGDFHKLWRTHTPNSYHMEYGYSCMGYEIPAAMGVKVADPSREVYTFVGDATYLMMPSEIVTAVQEGIKLIIVVANNHGFASIGGLSQSLGSGGFGTRFRMRNQQTGQLDGKELPIDFVAITRGLGADAISVSSIPGIPSGAEDRTRSTVHHRDCGGNRARGARSGLRKLVGCGVAEVSSSESVQQTRSEYEEAIKKERYFLYSGKKDRA